MRMQPWEPDKVIAMEDGDSIISPEAFAKACPGQSKQLLKLISIRNLSRRIISECCSMSWQPTAK